MSQRSFTIKNVVVAVPGQTTDQGHSYQTVDCRIEGSFIKQIAPTGQLPPSSSTSDIVIDGTNKLLLPGFVNGHTHSSEMWCRGLIPNLPLELWLAELIDFSENIDPYMLYLSAKLTAVETLLSGGTTVLDHLSPIPGKEVESIEAAIRGYQEVGIRTYIAPLISDLDLKYSIPTSGSQPSYDSEKTKYLLDSMKTIIEKFHRPEEGINIGVGPTGIQRCSDELFKGCIKLSETHNLIRHTHVLETLGQAQLSQEKYGKTGVAHLHELGFFDSKTSCAHAIHLSEKDMEILSSTGSTIVHNPLSNLRLGSGICPLLKYKQKNVNIAFGCDGSANNDAQDCLEVLKIGCMLQSITEADYKKWLTPFEVIERASQGGAAGVGQNKHVGMLKEGFKADLVLYKLDELCLLPRTDPIRLLIYGRPQNVIDSAWVDGKLVIQQGKIITTDVEQLKKELFEKSNWDLHNSKTSQLRAMLEPIYRQVHNLKPLEHK